MSQSKELSSVEFIQDCQTITAEMLDLLLTADPNIDAVTQYIPGETTVVATINSLPIGIVVLVRENNQYELKNIAVANDYQGIGLGKILVEKAILSAKAAGAKSLIVGTGNSSLDQLAFYQKCGFRIISIKRGYFASYDPPIVENGIACMDMVMMELEF